MVPYIYELTRIRDIYPWATWLEVDLVCLRFITHFLQQNQEGGFQAERFSLILLDLQKAIRQVYAGNPVYYRKIIRTLQFIITFSQKHHTIDLWITTI